MQLPSLISQKAKFCKEFCTTYRHSEGSIADALADKIPRWTAWVPVLIQAATGAGKTYFILHHLVPFVVATGGRLLLVSNRLAASVQQKRELMQILQHPLEGGLTDLGLQKMEDFGPVRVMTIQKLQHFINTDEGQEWCRGVTYLVVDEVHFFTSDFMFNHWTGMLLHQMPEVFCLAVRIYMTATPEDVLYPLAKAEYKTPLPIAERFRRRYQYPPYPLGASERKYMEVHRFTVSYDHIQLRYFHRTDDLVKLIQATPANEKWLLFVMSIKKGEYLQKELGSKIGEKNVCLITATDKGSPPWSKIVNDESLPCRVTITTSVLDCGVNIVEEAFKHIGIYSVFRTNFLQSLGRKRYKEGWTATLYVPVPDPQYLAMLRGQITKQRALVRTMENGSEDEKERLFRELWISDEQALKAMVWLDRQHQLHLNDVAVHAVECQKDQLDELEKESATHGNEAFPRIVHGWLQQEAGYDKSNWLGADKIAECRAALLEYLEKHYNEVLVADEDQMCLQDMILDLLLLETNQGNRKDREKLRHTALNNRLRKLHIPFQIDNEKGKWTILRYEVTDSDNEQ